MQYFVYQNIHADAAIPDRSSVTLLTETRVFQAIGTRTTSMNSPSVHRPPTMAPNSARRCSCSAAISSGRRLADLRIPPVSVGVSRRGARTLTSRPASVPMLSAMALSASGGFAAGPLPASIVLKDESVTSREGFRRAGGRRGSGARRSSRNGHNRARIAGGSVPSRYSSAVPRRFSSPVSSPR